MGEKSVQCAHGEETRTGAGAGKKLEKNEETADALGATQPPLRGINFCEAVALNVCSQRDERDAELLKYDAYEDPVGLAAHLWTERRRARRIIR